MHWMYCYHGVYVCVMCVCGSVEEERCWRLDRHREPQQSSDKVKEGDSDRAGGAQAAVEEREVRVPETHTHTHTHHTHTHTPLTHLHVQTVYVYISLLSERRLRSKRPRNTTWRCTWQERLTRRRQTWLASPLWGNRGRRLRGGRRRRGEVGIPGHRDVTFIHLTDASTQNSVQKCRLSRTKTTLLEVKVLTRTI